MTKEKMWKKLAEGLLAVEGLNLSLSAVGLNVLEKLLGSVPLLLMLVHVLAGVAGLVVVLSWLMGDE